MQPQLDTLISVAASAQRPTLVILRRSTPEAQAAERLGVFPAAFAPPTFAHLALIQRARRQARLDAVLLLLNLRNADKGDLRRNLQHSVAMLELLCRRVPWLGLGLSSHPYFLDMLEALRGAGMQGRVSFLVGFDTLVRILDPEGRYLGHYATPRASLAEALAALFTNAAALVAGRAQRSARDLRDLLREQGAAAWQASISYLPMPRGLHGVSSSLVRERVRGMAGIEDLVPRSIAAYIATHRLYEGQGCRPSRGVSKSYPSPREEA